MTYADCRQRVEQRGESWPLTDVQSDRERKLA